MQIKPQGFTLLEILIALLVFSVLSLILVNALHNVIQSQERTEITAQRLRSIQFFWLKLSRDIEQIIDRQVINNEGVIESSFIGNEKGFVCTHMGMSSAEQSSAIGSSLQRTKYMYKKPNLWRIVWPVLDRAPDTKQTARDLLSADKIDFDYFDQEGKPHKKWPIDNKTEFIPRAIRITIAALDGIMSQTYIIAAQSSKKVPDADPP